MRVTVSGVVSYVKAREKDGKSLKVHTPIRVRRLLGQTMVEVEEDKGDEPEKKEEQKKEAEKEQLLDFSSEDDDNSCLKQIN